MENGFNASADEYSVTWFPCFTAGLILLARNGFELCTKYMPAGYGNGRKYIVVLTRHCGAVEDKVCFIDNIEEAVLLRLKYGARIVRNPEASGSECIAHVG